MLQDTNITPFTFQSGSILIDFIRTLSILNDYLYIPIWFYSNVITDDCEITHYYLYIPIWFYSNPSPIIPHIYGLLKVLFVDLCFQTYSAVIFSASYSYYLHLYLCYNGFVYLPIFQVYHRSTIISIQSMFHIIFKSYSLTR